MNPYLLLLLFTVTSNLWKDFICKDPLATLS